jgi:hypothetical protein
MGKYQSLVRNETTILALNDERKLLSLTPTRDALTVTSQRQVADDSWAYLGVFDGGLLVRDLEALKIFRWDR